MNERSKRMTKWHLIFSLTLGLLAFGCGGGLQVEPVAATASPPGNVAVLVSVEKNNSAVTGLTAASFKISEDGQELTKDQTQQTLLPPDSVTAHHALLLVDMSGPVTEGELRQKIANAAARFVTKAHKTQPVTVYAFDGGTEIHQIATFPQGDDEIPEIKELTSYTPQDSSSNLNSSVVAGLEQLEAKLSAAHRQVRVGSLVVFARGPDLAGRVPESKMNEAISSSKHRVYAISAKDAPGFRASQVGKDGAFEAMSLSALDGAFEEAGTRVANDVGTFYLLAYCSPARAGKRHLRVKVVATDEQGKAIDGSVTSEFDANGFTSGCNPGATPRFEASAEPEPEEAKKEEKEEKKGAKKEEPEEPAPKKKKAKAASGSAHPAPSGAAASEKPAPAPSESDEAVPPPDKAGYAH